MTACRFVVAAKEGLKLSERRANRTNERVSNFLEKNKRRRVQTIVNTNFWHIERLAFIHDTHIDISLVFLTPL